MAGQCGGHGSFYCPYLPIADAVQVNEPGSLGNELARRVHGSLDLTAPTRILYEVISPPERGQQ